MIRCPCPVTADGYPADGPTGRFLWDLIHERALTEQGVTVLVICARQDLPGFGEQKYRPTFSRWYPNLEPRFITDAGHFPRYETPVYLTTLVEGFLGTHTPGDPPRQRSGRTGTHI